MPAVKYIQTKANRAKASKQALTAIGKLIRGYSGTASGLARTIHVSQPTAQSRLNNPGELTLEELIDICIAYDIPCEDVVAKISW